MSLRQVAEQIIAWYAEGQRPTGDDIVDTLREALAQHDEECETGPSRQDLWDCWDAVHSGKQEPTAWMDAAGDLTFRTPSVKLRPYWTPLYLHPAPIPNGWQLAIDHYEQALKASWTEGAKGEAFTHWNEARKALLFVAPKYEEQSK